LPFHENEGIILLWSILRADLEEESAGVLLQMVVNQWVKIRGFSFSSCWAEKYKAAQRKMTQVKGCPKTAASQMLLYICIVATHAQLNHKNLLRE